jgi:hypothetical protein
MLVKIQPMDRSKPSQLLANMMEFCSAGIEKVLPFHYYFTQCLPPVLRTELGELENGDPRALVAWADTMHLLVSASAAAIKANKLVMTSI